MLVGLYLNYVIRNKDDNRTETNTYYQCNYIIIDNYLQDNNNTRSDTNIEQIVLNKVQHRRLASLKGETYVGFKTVVVSRHGNKRAEAKQRCQTFSTLYLPTLPFLWYSDSTAKVLYRYLKPFQCMVSSRDLLTYPRVNVSVCAVVRFTPTGFIVSVSLLAATAIVFS